MSAPVNAVRSITRDPEYDSCTSYTAGFLAHASSCCCPPSRDNEVFRTEAVRLLPEAAYYPFSMLDEIGGFELVIPQFREALGVFLSSSSPCIGVVKTLDEAELMRSYLGLGERFSALAQRLHAALEADSDTLVIDVSEQDMGPAEKAVREWAKVYAG